MRTRWSWRLPGVAVLIALVLQNPVPASAGTLTGPTFTVSVPYTYTSVRNTSYDWAFTTASTATLSKVTMTVPAGTTGPTPYLALPGLASNNGSTPDSAANSITGDMDIRAKVMMADWTPAAERGVVAKWNTTGNQRSYLLGVRATGELALHISTDGTANVAPISTVPVGAADGSTTWIRATLDLDNGSNQRVANFYTSADGTSWTSLGSTVTASPALAPVYDSNTGVEIGSWNNGTPSSTFAGRVYYAEIRNGIGGTVVNKFDPSEAPAASPSSWTAGTGETWTVNRSGTNLPADIASDLTVWAVTGLPSGGSAVLRRIDGKASYSFTSTSVPSSTSCTLSLAGFTNTATPGSYTSTITTYDNAGPPPVAVDNATTAALVFADLTASPTVTGTVAPTLTFAVSGRSSTCNNQSSSNFQTGSSSTAVSLGRLNPSTVGGGAQDLSVSTNAANGFTVYVRTLGTTPNSLRDGSGHTIADVSGTRAAPSSTPVAGTAGFGYTSDDTSTAFTSNSWAKLTSANDSVLIGSAGTQVKAACVGYEVAVAATTPAGAYATRLAYTAVPIF